MTIPETPEVQVTDNAVIVPLIAVYGTFAGDFEDSAVPCEDGSHWWHPISQWWTYVRTLGQPDVQFVPFRDDEDFSWTGELEGSPLNVLWGWLTLKKAKGRFRQWKAGGSALSDYIAVGVNLGRNPTRFVVVAHSHGGQVALYSAAEGRHIPLLITVSTPRRSDMNTVIDRARPRIGFWVHLYDPDGDRVAQEGMLGDGDVSFERTFKQADINVPLKGCSHSGALRDPAKYHLWKEAVLPVIAERLADWHD